MVRNIDENTSQVNGCDRDGHDRDKMKTKDFNLLPVTLPFMFIITVSRSGTGTTSQEPGQTTTQRCG